MFGKLFRRRSMPEPTPPSTGSPLTHREYVGGLWEEIGRLQLDFLVGRGLEPHHVLLDVACGALRGGVHFIRYLQAGNYLGLDKEEWLIRAGVEKELGPELTAAKRPELVVSAAFEFERFSRHPDYAIAQSLFTHLLPEDVHRCLVRLRAFVSAGCRLYATFNEVPKPIINPEASQDHAYFRYTRAEMTRFGEETSWSAEYLGDWGHPRGQMMMEYRAG